MNLKSSTSLYVLVAALVAALCCAFLPTSLAANCPRNGADWISITNNASASFPATPVAFAGDVCPEFTGSTWCCNRDLAAQVQKQRLATIRDTLVANLTAIASRLKSWVDKYNVTRDDIVSLLHAFIDKFGESNAGAAAIIRYAVNQITTDILNNVNAPPVLKAYVEVKKIAFKISKLHANLTRAVERYNFTGLCRNQLRRAACAACGLETYNVCANVCSGVLRGCTAVVVRNLFRALNATVAVYDKISVFAAAAKDNARLRMIEYLTNAAKRLSNWNPPADAPYTKLQLAGALITFQLATLSSVTSFIDDQAALFQNNAQQAKTTIQAAIVAVENIYRQACNAAHGTELTNTNCWNGNATVVTFSVPETDTSLATSSAPDASNGLDTAGAQEFVAITSALESSSAEADQQSASNAGSSAHSATALGLVASLLVAAAMLML